MFQINYFYVIFKFIKLYLQDLDFYEDKIKLLYLNRDEEEDDYCKNILFHNNYFYLVY